MAKKPKLTHRQQRQVAANRNKRLKNGPSEEAVNSADLIEGRVVGRFGKHADVEVRLADNIDIFRCHIRRTIDSVVCGDDVLISKDQHTKATLNGVIEIVKDRRSMLSRPDYYDGVKPVAANIDQIIIVSAVLPTVSLNIIDRYLVACEHINIHPVIVMNKVELLNTEDEKQLHESLEIYRQLGYSIIFTSCKTGQGLDDLNRHLSEKTNIFVGQSGVGKSSLINQILPDADEVVGDISETSGLGQHTTTSAKLLHLPCGGDLIDSPGVREFGLWHLTPEEVTWGFIEFRQYIGGCKFRDCKHLNDPGCMIREAAEKGEISQIRLDSYHKILATMEEQRPSYIPSN
ncbi:small ribosomal subunit biogenesis GTPase RsgA [Alteromonas ponticola]|uniref:Small ribosomal subunit biogenesis GTPase RsgA n=1 Tax=Alteromonas aquimaris TaxID=2998417 RepID=A0ABT3P2D2_9ALTE|nr:small ribosomal subunit biogenesis GTPase RsgA [Alteromonas aquimaris]MCW8106919.1 small ribosomal subunit biogenesis GTPase RsgA [Alteromonas aquimaris]